MTSWRENKVIGVTAGIIFLISAVVVIINIAKNAMKFKKVTPDKILTAGPTDINKKGDR